MTRKRQGEGWNWISVDSSAIIRVIRVIRGSEVLPARGGGGDHEFHEFTRLGQSGVGIGFPFVLLRLFVCIRVIRGSEILPARGGCGDHEFHEFTRIRQSGVGIGFPLIRLRLFV